MNTKHLTTLFLLILFFAATACEPETTGPRAWIDIPLDGARVPVGAPVAVVSHAYAREGIAEVLLAVNGVAYRRSPPASNESFAKMTHEWIPQNEGDYLLQITAFSKTGETSNPASARVRAIGKTTRTPTPVASATPTPVITATPPRGAIVDLELVSVEAFVTLTKGEQQFCDIRVTYRNAGTIPIPNDYTIQAFLDGRPHAAITRGRGFGVGGTSEAIFVYQFTGTAYIGINLDSTNAIAESNESNNAFAEARSCGVAPAATIVPSPTIPLPVITLVPSRTSTTVPTAIIPAQINFRADQTTLTRGQCTTLRWDVENATAVYLEGNGVPGHGTQQMCPNNTTTYTLRVNAPAGTADRNVTINVQIPANTPTRTPTKIQDTQGPPAPGLVTPKGNLSCRANVTLDWNAVSDPSGIKHYIVKWVRNDGPSGGTITTSTQHSISVTCGKAYTWSVQAVDNAGNEGGTASANFAIDVAAPH
ncbi:MAG: hypothetical protein HZC40_20925 [Chloroflexi bacterium]|nr:hypothetical protein [Chloroflexota bacterium]